MSALLTIQAPPADAPEVLLAEMFLISVDRYHAMIEAGVLGQDDNIELIHGRLVTRMAKDPPHETANHEIQSALARVVPSGWFVATQRPMTTSDSEPEPDVMVVRGRARDYANRHPRPEDTSLVVEVSESSLRRDRGPKRLLYAGVGIPHYWIANLVDHRIECFSAPSNGNYTVRHDYRPGDEVPLILDGREIGKIAVDQLLV